MIANGGLRKFSDDKRATLYKFTRQASASIAQICQTGSHTSCRSRFAGIARVLRRGPFSSPKATLRTTLTVAACARLWKARSANRRTERQCQLGPLGRRLPECLLVARDSVSSAYLGQGRVRSSQQSLRADWLTCGASHPKVRHDSSQGRHALEL